MWPVGYDAHSYWAADLAAPYDVRLAGTQDFYPYSPAFLQLITPLRLLPFGAFLGVWTALGVGVLAALAGPLAALLVLLPPVWLELVVGNVNLFIGGAVVLGFRYPAAWAFVLLTKLTPGVGLVWFLVRREWRSLGVALAVTAVIAAVSVALSPGAWRDWLGVVGLNATGSPAVEAYLPLPLLVRLPLGALIVAFAGWTDRRWLVPVGAFIALPVIWESSFSLLVAVIPLLRREPSAARP